MGAKNSTENSGKTPEEIKREKLEKDHAAEVKRILERPDATKELKDALIECAKTKKNLQEVHSVNDTLKSELNGARSQIESLTRQMEHGQEFQREMVFTGGVTLALVVGLFAGVYLLSSSLHNTPSEAPLSGGHSFSAASLLASEPHAGNTGSALLVVSKDTFTSVLASYPALQQASVDASDIFTALQSSRSRVSYYELLAVIQRELMPEITFGLIAACMAITLLFTALLGAIVPNWASMSKEARLHSVLMTMGLFMLLGLYLSSLQDSIDIPAGVALTLSVLCCPLVAFTGIEALHAKTGAPWRKYEPEWCIVLSCVGMIVLSVALLHTIVFAPLAIVTIGAASVLLWVVMWLGLKRVGSDDVRRNIALVAIWALSVAAWRHGDLFVALLQPRRHNATYSLVTNVATWLDWGLMLNTFTWFLASYTSFLYRSPHTVAWHQQAGAKNAYGPPGVVYACVLLNFAHVVASLMRSADAAGDSGVTVGAFAHLCGVYFAAEAFYLTLATFQVKAFPGLSEVLCGLNAAMLYFAKNRGYSVFMVLSVLNVAMYILLKYGVLAALLVAAVAIVAVAFIS